MSDDTTVWNTIFAREGAVSLKPQEDVPEIANSLKLRRGAATVLDLGCGSGRHVVYLARQGFTVYGLDGAAAGLEIALQALAGAGLTAELRQDDIYAPLPYADAVFDAIISTQVIHHATLARIRALVAEVARVVKPGGLVFVTVPSQRNQGKRFEQIAPGTLVPLDGREAGLPHHYFTPDELRAAFSAFDVTDQHMDKDHHYCLTAYRR